MALLVAAQVPLLVGMAEPRHQQAANPPADPSPSPETPDAAQPPDQSAQTISAPNSFAHNNIVGLNLARLHQPRYVWVASQIANANGGAWGYATILLTNADRDSQLPVHLLQQILDRCYEVRLQPIVRVGTRFDEGTGIWDRPTDDDPLKWRTLFEQVRWPNRTVWVVPANEPNLGREWGGAVDVASYSRYLERFLDTFADSDRFNVVNAPLNLSNAHKPPIMQDAFEFLAEHMDATPTVFERLPGWASNSYRVDGLGEGQRFTHRGYELELETIGRELPVLITESGFLNQPNEEDVARFFTQAYRDWMNDRRVVAATPLFWDPDVDHHWMFTLDEEGSVESGSATYRALRELPRIAGSPDLLPPMANTVRIQASAVQSRPLPIFLPDPPPATSSEDVREP